MIQLRRSTASLLGAAVVGLLAAGCSDPGTAGRDTSVPVDTPPATPSPASIVGPAIIRLRRFPDGLAVVGLDATTRQLDVEVKVVGLRPGTTHPASLLRGGCAQPGALAYRLDPMTADARGVADVTTKVDNVAESTIPTSGWDVTVDTAGSPSVPMACGEVTNTADASVVSVGIGPVNPVGSPDRDAVGTATLTASGGQLTVTLDVTGLTPGASHAADLRKGTCEALGPEVVQPLQPVTGDPSGHALVTTRIPGVSRFPAGVWYVDVHGAGAVAQTTLDPLVCGNVGP
jgi:hypothetical protein